VRHLLVHLEHRRCASNEPAWLRRRDARRPLAPVSALLQRPDDDAFDVGDVERLADVVEGPGPDGFDRGFERAEPADQHHLA